MTAQRCRICGREFPETEQFCSQDGARLTGSDSELDANAMRDLLAGLVGCTLDGRYRIVRVIGEGGMGVVYEALHVVLEKRVAIKVLRDTFSARADVVERFRQEAKSASKIGHPNIVDVSDFGETPTGQSYIVMEMLTGEDLADLLARVRVLPPGRAVRIVYQVARALDATHKKNIVHRDLKPENIYLVERDGIEDFVKVVDFGVAKMSEPDTTKGRKLTRTGMLFGTPEYMSPEQALGQGFDHRIDVYALGAILFELLTGRVPFVGDTFMGILAQHGHAPLPSLHSVNPSISVSPELVAIVQRALAKDPDARYQTMGAFAEELRRAPEMPAPSPTEARVAKWSPTTPFTIVHGDAESEARQDKDTTEAWPKREGARSLPSHALIEDAELDEPALAVLPAFGVRLLPPPVIGAFVVAALLMFGMVAIAAQRTARPRLLQSTSSSGAALSPSVPAPPAAVTAASALEHAAAEASARDEAPELPDSRALGASEHCAAGGCAASTSRRAKAGAADVPADGELEARSARPGHERSRERQAAAEPLADRSDLDAAPGAPSKRSSTGPRKAHLPTDLKIPSAFR